MIVTASTPIVTITGSQYFSIPVGGTLPTIAAVAYDTFYRDSLPVLIDQAGLDNTTPGMYTVLATAKNKYGFVGSANVYVAVTDITDSLDLTGFYIRNGAAGRSAHVTKLGRGMFMTSNVGGVDTSDATTGPVVSAVFAVTSPTKLTFGTQQVLDGGVSATLSSNSEQLIMIPGPPSDTSLVYAIQESSFGTQVRTFVKQ